jgi:hypothetical protein
MYSAQNVAFLNSIHNAAAAIAGFTGVSNPLGLSINNAFGRLWPANAPFGLGGIGSSTILDPTGTVGWGARSQSRRRLCGKPDATVAGPSHSWRTKHRRGRHRAPGRSPDGSTKAVFAVVCADGSIVQKHTLKALDGLVPAGTVSPLLGAARTMAMMTTGAHCPESACCSTTRLHEYSMSANRFEIRSW